MCVYTQIHNVRPSPLCLGFLPCEQVIPFPLWRPWGTAREQLSLETQMSWHLSIGVPRPMAVRQYTLVWNMCVCVYLSLRHFCRSSTKHTEATEVIQTSPHLNLSVVWEDIRDHWRFRFCILLISLSFKGNRYPNSLRRSKSGAMLLNLIICPCRWHWKASSAPSQERLGLSLLWTLQVWYQEGSFSRSAELLRARHKLQRDSCPDLLSLPCWGCYCTDTHHPLVDRRSSHVLSYLQDWLPLHRTGEDRNHAGNWKVHCILIKLNWFMVIHPLYSITIAI